MTSGFVRSTGAPRISTSSMRSLSSGPTAEWRERLDAFDVPNGVVTDLPGLLADPSLAETGFFEQVEHPSQGKMLTMAIATAFSRSPGSSFRLPPRQQAAHVCRQSGIDRGHITVSHCPMTAFASKGRTSTR
ncbi:MAG: CoA transferase [Acetobacteraceae bacterium]|nr:CoA transferase [Acetobacteraceae bacterium]